MDTAHVMMKLSYLQCDHKHCYMLYFIWRIKNKKTIFNLLSIFNLQIPNRSKHMATNWNSGRPTGGAFRSFGSAICARTHRVRRRRCLWQPWTRVSVKSSGGVNKRDSYFMNYKLITISPDGKRRFENTQDITFWQQVDRQKIFYSCMRFGGICTTLM